MQLIGILILVGILALLLLGAFYLSNTQKTHNPPESSIDDFYRSTGFGNVVDANKQMRGMLSTGGHQRHSQGKKGKQRRRQQARHRDEE